MEGRVTENKGKVKPTETGKSNRVRKGADWKPVSLSGLLFTSREGLVRVVVIRGHLGYSDHEMIKKLLILGEIRKRINKTYT